MSALGTPEKAAQTRVKAAALVEGRRRPACGQEKSFWGILAERGVFSLSEGISLPKKGCVTAEYYGFINQRRFHCPFTATQLLRLSLADSSLIHLPGEGRGTCCCSLLAPRKLQPPRLFGAERTRVFERFSPGTWQGFTWRQVFSLGPRTCETP